MKKLIYALVFLSACSTAPADVSKNNTAASTKDSIAPVADSKKEPVISIKNAADYSSGFINALKNMSEYQTIKLSGNKMVLNENDTVIFPATPAIGKKFKLTGRKDDVVIALIVTRINYTTIEYSIEMVEFGKANHTEKGQASISPSFFLGAESDENSATGNSYFATEFIDEKENDCYVAIRLGNEDDNAVLLGKLIKNCNGKLKDITLDSFPTLIEK